MLQYLMRELSALLTELVKGTQAVALNPCFSLPQLTFAEAVITLDFKQLPLISGPAQPRQLSGSRITAFQAAGRPVSNRLACRKEAWLSPSRSVLLGPHHREEPETS